MPPDPLKLTERADAPGDADFAGFEFECPHCGRILDDYQEACPRCGGPLAEEFSGTYRPAPSIVVKVIAGVVLLLGLMLAIAAVVGYLTREG